MTSFPCQPLRWKAPLISALALLAACEPPIEPPAPRVELAAVDAGVSAVSTKSEAVVVPPEAAPSASPRVSSFASENELKTQLASYFEGSVGRHVYLQVDKPIYQPGETVWIKSWDLRARSLQGVAALTASYQLVSPKGAVVLQKRVAEAQGMATNDFEIPADVQGGEYTLKFLSADGVQAERPLLISTYEAPRLKMKLEFVRKAYGEGDEVTATFEVKRTTGEPLAAHEVTAAIRLDGADLPRVKLTTGADGTGLLRFTLPAPIATGDGLLTVLVEDAGVTESVSKRIPILVHKLQFAAFPEGGKLVRSLPGRLYFEAQTPLGKPADVAGRIVDDLGNAVASFQSYKDGLGRIDFTPATGRTYRARITQPVGISESYALPLPLEDGCALRTYDDLDGQLPALRVAVRCTEAKKVVLTAVLRENTLDTATVEVQPDQPSIVYLEPKDAALTRAQGIARVTLFDENLQPLAERLVFRNRRSRLGVKVEPDQTRYTPRAPVSLKITTTDPAGAPVAAELALSVVDDTVVSFADDKTGHLLSRLMLEPEIPGKVEEPNTYFDLTDVHSALAMDLLMGTRGWRTFEWQPVLHPVAVVTASALPPEERLENVADDKVDRFANLQQVHAKPAAVRGPPIAPRHPAVPAAPDVGRAHVAAHLERIGAVNGLGFLGRGEGGGGFGDGHGVMAKDLDWNRAGGKAGAPFGGLRNRAEPLAPVRVFPVPTYAGEAPTVRTDFRETIFWAPSVKTDATGHASVTFPVSDAVTSFRLFAEGVGQGFAGHEESVIASSLPFSMTVKLPTEVSAGDVLDLPLTLSNEQGRELDVTLDASFGSLLTLQGDPAKGGALAANARRSLFFPVQVTGQQGESEVRFAARTGGLSDEFVRKVNVTRLGFPETLSRSGKVAGTATETFDLGEAIPNSADVTLKLYPSPVATLVSGLEGMLREPTGCFEQTSSTNYPNVMVMGFLRSHDIADPALLDRSSALLDSGYRRLTGYESKSHGYEWFGGDPGHEALTAYGLLEFMDMKRVYGNVDEEMLQRTVRWLKSRRDGRGGYQRDAKALDSFGRASPEVTDAYLTYALVRAGETDLPAEIEKSASVAGTTADAYVLALAANTLLRAPGRHEAGVAAVNRLVAMQEADGSWHKEDHSITHSGGSNLWIETTSLAVLALLESHTHEGETRHAVEWLQANRGGFGQWGATQATVLALQAMTAYDDANRRTPTAGTVAVRVNGEPAGEVSYEAGRREAITFARLGAKLKAGQNTIELVQTGGDGLPYSMAIEYRSLKPATCPEAQVDLKTVLEKSTVKMGETVRLDATVTNKTAQGLPMTMARIGLPGGLTFQTWQLKELREKGLIAFYETRAREVILYFRDLGPNEVKAIPLDLIAFVPGHYTGPASSAYLYYNDQHRTWTDALVAQIDP